MKVLWRCLVLLALCCCGVHVFLYKLSGCHIGSAVPPVVNLTGVWYRGDLEGALPLGGQFVRQSVRLFGYKDIITHLEWVHSVRLGGVRHILLGDLAAGRQGL